MCFVYSFAAADFSFCRVANILGRLVHVWLLLLPRSISRVSFITPSNTQGRAIVKFRNVHSRSKDHLQAASGPATYPIKPPASSTSAVTHRALSPTQDTVEYQLKTFRRLQQS